MPTWITMSDRADAIQAHVQDRPESLEWMKLFQPGRGYRVHLVPNRDEMITNTFSMISADRDKEYHLHSNAMGFRGPDVPEAKAPGVFRILIFGDSSSFGWGVDDADTYATVIERSLEAKLPGKQVEVANFAVPGDSSEFGRLIAEKMLPLFAPDLVIFGFGANDAHLTYTPHQAQIEKFRKAGTLQDIRGLLQSSALISSLTALADLKKASAPPPGNRSRVTAVPVGRYEQNLAALVRLAKTNGAKRSLLFTICAPGNYRHAAEYIAKTNSELFFDGQKYLVDHIPDLKAGNLYPELVDAMRASYGQDLAKNDLFYITNDGCHPNKVGYRMLGEVIAERIAPIASTAADAGNAPS